MKSLVLAEKPSVARDIARVLNCKKQLGGALEGDQYVVTWALGHLVTLADPEEYDKKYMKWEMSTLPMMPQKMELVVIRQTAKQYGCVKAQMYRKDIDSIIIATDAGREGELVARWILDKANCHKPIKRLWISSVTDKAIKEGFAHLKDGRQYNDLYAAAESRAEADWLVGMNATRALTCRYNAQLSCGRVQTPTLAMIASREQEIRKFVPKEYYGMKVQSGNLKFTWQDGKSHSRATFQKERIEEIEKKLKKASELTVVSAETKEKRKDAPGLYDLTELQRDANKRYGFSAKQTLNYMQKLYESHKVLTYPRTDSRFITTDVVDTIKERLQACAVGPYRTTALALSRKPIKAKSSFVNNAKVTDHHAIIPTEQFVDLKAMSREERCIYDLVVRRFLAVLLPAYVYEQVTLKAEAASELFTATGNAVKEAGWKAAYEPAEGSLDSGWIPEDEEEETQTGETGNGTKIAGKAEQLELSAMKKGAKIPLQNASITNGKTKPPAYHTEATLLTAMEKNGLGTVATRADIIEKLFKSFVIEKKDKEIHSTAKGRQLLELVPAELRETEMTASWEKKLMQISEGKLKRDVFISDIRDYTCVVVEEIKSGTGTFRHDNLTNKKCPQCGKRLLSVNGKNSKMLVCQDRECGYRETLSRTSNARCPKCHKKMELVGTGESQTFICKCGYKEKLSNFKSRREKEGAGVSKRDVQKFLNQQKKEAAEPETSAFAAAFAKLNLK